MGVIRLQNVTKQFGGQVVLNDVTLDLHTGETAALIGANGVGKTTLFKLIAGMYPPDLGTVTLSKGLEVGYLPQEPDVPEGTTLRQAVSEAFSHLLELERKLHDLSHEMAALHDDPRLADLMAEYDRTNARFEVAGGYSFEQRLGEVLGGLGFKPSDYEQPIATLSGGQKCRAALAKLLLRDAQYLLLDEPTNHLDIDAVRWLEKFLAGHHGGALIISHDRYLLDRLAERTIDVQAGTNGARITSYPGNYSNYVKTRDVRILTQQRQYEQDKAYIEKERDYIQRYIAGQRTKTVQGRQKRLERRIADGEFVLEKPTEQRRQVKLDFGELDRHAERSREIVRVDDLHKQYDDKVLFTGLTLDLWTGQRLGITGPNGTGKTTLLRILLGQVAAEAGKLRIDPTARVGYFAQQPEDLDPEKTVIDEIRAVRNDFLERDARNYAARFLFSGEEPFKRVGSLSGGEQSRVRFMKMVLTAPDVLLLDEPTNHLDIPSREALEAALAEFPGTIIAVSHDRFFLDRIAERLLVIRGDGHRVFNGNYSYYIEQIEQERAAAEAAASGPRSRKRSRGGGGGASGGTTAAKPKSRYQKMKLEELEAFIAEHEQRIAEMHEQFGDAEIYKDTDKLHALRAAFETLKAELAEAEEAWLERAENV